MEDWEVKDSMGGVSGLFSKEQACRILVDPEGKIARRYGHYREFLIRNHDALSIMSELELLYENSRPFPFSYVKKRSAELIKATRDLVGALNALSGGKYEKLSGACHRIESQIRPIAEAEAARSSHALVIPLTALNPDAVTVAGTKATHLALLGSVLGLPVPQGFVVTANAFDRFLEENGLRDLIEETLAGLPGEDPDAIDSSTKAVREKILKAPVPPAVAQEILTAYDNLQTQTRQHVPVAVRSTAVGEDTEASFAGQYVTVLNVGRDGLLEAYKTVLASKYTPRAIWYRTRYGLDDRETPMCVAVIEMIEAKASGVVYTADPAQHDRQVLVINALFGLGEHLVSGQGTPDLYHVDRESGEILRKDIQRKEQRLVVAEGRGTRLEAVPDAEQAQPAIDDDTVRTLARHALKVESHFKAPQDIEWAVDPSGRLRILQARPLHLSSQVLKKTQVPPADRPILLRGGVTASGGIATGRVWMPDERGKKAPVPPEAIMVTSTASPEYARLAGKVKGIITNIGGTASHLGSVARELGVPAIFSTRNATDILPKDEWITMVADTATVYRGRLQGEETAPIRIGPIRPVDDEVFETRDQTRDQERLRALLDNISPLTLTDPEAPAFAPEQCRTIHDIIRYAHEKVVQEMFGLSREATGALTSVRMKANIPLQLYFIDLGGGLKPGLTTCDDITPDSIESTPMKALWRGLSHPGVTWAGSINVTGRSMMALMTAGPPPTINSYAIVSQEYLNLSIKFGYHYTNLDVFCGEDPDQNYVTLQFAGGAGSYYGRAMRINFLGEVLQRLGFTLNISGDLLEAALKGYDKQTVVEALDQLGRLLATSRLLDLAIPNQAQVGAMTERFFKGDYDFLQSAGGDLPGFYTPIGNWKRVSEEGRPICLQDGSKSGDPFSCGLNIVMGKVIGSRYQDFLDRIRAHHYFPMAIAKESNMAGGTVQVRIKPESGCLDRAGGLAFAVRNVGNCFVLGLSALQNRVTLFQFVNNRPFKRATAERQIESGRWHLMRIDLRGRHMSGFLDGELVAQHEAEGLLEGYIGLWTKADSKTYFDELIIKEGSNIRLIAF